jgi:hypothetical protein
MFQKKILTLFYSMIILFALIHSLYIIYVLNYFKTKYSIAHPITYFSNDLLYHPIGTSDTPTSKVCKLGNLLSWYLAAFILIRGILIYYKKIKISLKNISLIILIIGVMLSMLNLNVVLYLIPHFIIEIAYIKYSLF